MTAHETDRDGPQWGLLVATSLGFAVVQLDVSVVNVAIKPIGASLGGGVSSLQWVVNAYTVAFAALILTAGALGDRIGAKRVFTTGFVLFTLASAACGLAPSLGVLIAARAVQGIGAALLLPCSLTLLNHAHPDAGDRARAVGLWLAGASVALSGGPLVGGVLTSAFGWRSIFFINAPIGVVGILATARWARETPRHAGRALDLAGQLAAVLTLGALAGAVIEGGVSGFGDPAVLGGFALAAASAVAFLGVEARRAEPMLPLGLFASATFSTATAVGLLVNTAFYGLIFVLSLYFQRAQGLSPLQTGLAFAPMTAVVMAANIVSGPIGQGANARRVVAVGTLLLGAGSAALLGADATTPYLQLVAQLVAIGVGLGLIVPVITSTLLGSVDASRSGIAAGTLNTARQAGSVIGVALFGSLAAARGGVTSGLHASLAICVGIAVLVLALAPRIERPAAG